MSEINRAASFAKNFQKHAGRAKELFRQNLGKADKTTDEDFEEYVKNFSKQQYASSRLARELRNYQNCAKAMQTASKALTDVICELYEPNWVEHDKIQVQADVLEKKWEDYHSTINEQVIKPLVAYTEQFPDVNSKILKRRRKLLDYDCSRHTIQNLEQNSKRREESKIAKAREQLIEKRQLYEMINAELLEELPALYDSRVSFFASNLQCLFLAEVLFHNESAKLFNDLNDAVEALAIENQKGVYCIRKQLESHPDAEPNESFVSAKDRSSSSEYLSTETLVCSDNSNSVLENAKPGEFIPDLEAERTLRLEASETTVKTADGNEKTAAKNEEVASEVCTGVSGEDLPSDALYKVKATHQYTAEDDDELSFEPGDIIYVIEFEDPEQQEDGWSMGYKDGSGFKGLFPENFTRRF